MPAIRVTSNFKLLDFPIFNFSRNAISYDIATRNVRAIEVNVNFITPNEVVSLTARALKPRLDTERENG